MAKWLHQILRAKPTSYNSSLILNLLGFQLARTAFFNFRRVARWPKKISAEYQPALDRFIRDGVLVVPDFFSPDDYRHLKEEFARLKADFHRSGQELPPRAYKLSLSDKRVSPKTRELIFRNPMIRQIALGFLNRPYHLPWLANYHQITVDASELHVAKNGGTNNLHFDAPLRVLKVFFYISDTDESNGAFRYCYGSQKRGLKKLFYEYRRSIRYALNRYNKNHGGEYYDGEPWVKIDEKEMRALGLKETSVSGRGNTLIFANTGGYHRRGDHQTPGDRETIEINFRPVESLRNSLYPLEQAVRSWLSPRRKEIHVGA